MGDMEKIKNDNKMFNTVQYSSFTLQSQSPIMRIRADPDQDPKHFLKTELTKNNHDLLLILILTIKLLQLLVKVK